MLNSTPARRRPQARQRGALLVEAALAVGIAVSLVGLTISLNREQQVRADAITLAGEQRLVLDAARTYVFESRAEIIDDLFEAAKTGGAGGQLVVSIADIIDAGYLSPTFTPGAAIDRIAGQGYTLLIRPVFQSDVNIPAATLTELDMDPFGTGIVDPRYIDGDLSNEEVGIEAVLFSTDGTPLPPGQGARVVEAIERINAGFVYNGIQSRGAGGTMDFNITGFEDFTEYASIGAGRFASPVALGSIGVLGSTSGDGGAADLREVFLRCVGVDPTSIAYNDCMNAERNQVYGGIELIPYDSTGDTVPDVYPAISGATRLLCADAIGDISDPVNEGAFLIDCQTTQVNGVLDVTGSAIQFAGDTLVETRDIAGEDQVTVAADRFALRLPGGAERDLSETVFSSVTIAARDTIEVPECHGEALDGSSLVPLATAHVAAVLDPWGRSISGAFAYAERGNGTSATWSPDENGNRWLARIRYTVESNFCDATFANPIDIRSTFSNPNDATSAQNFLPDSIVPNIPGVCSFPPPASANTADVYELYPVGEANYGVAGISVSCGLAPGP